MICELNEFHKRGFQDKMKKIWLRFCFELTVLVIITVRVLLVHLSKDSEMRAVSAESFFLPIPYPKENDIPYIANSQKILTPLDNVW